MQRFNFSRHAVLGAIGLGASLLTLPGCNRPLATTEPVEPQAARIKKVDLSGVKFSDATARSGLDFQQLSGGCGLNYFIEQLASGAALLDANGDGFLDIYFAQPKPLGDCAPKFKQPLRQRLYINDGKGRFALSPGAFGGVETGYGLAAAVGDYDNDGDADLYVACHGGNKLFSNRGDGTFADSTKRAGVALGGLSTGAVWFDYDRDGYLDLYVTRYCEWSIQKDIVCPGPEGQRSVCDPQTYPASQHALFHNNRNGTFSDVTKRAGVGGERRRGLGVAAADFDGDGRLDLFVANDLSPNFLYINKGNGTFEDQSMQQAVAFGLTGKPQANMGVAVGDSDEDGDLDALITTFSNEPYTLYRNDKRFFTDVSATTGLYEATLENLGFGTGFLDTANRGQLDLFFANGHVAPFISHVHTHMTYKQRNQLLINNGQGNFTQSHTALPKDDVRVHRGAYFGDVDNDGRVDILVTANNDRPTLLKNESVAGNWLMLKLTDKHGCATPVGTRCTATFKGKKRLRVVLGGGSYGGESDHRIHFGLGDATEIETLEIRWLSGRSETLRSVKANQVLMLREGKSLTASAS